MAYDEVLAQRIRDLAEGEPGLTERKMFGGLGFMVGGNMGIAAAGKGGLMVRVDPAEGERLCEEPHVDPMEMHGKSMTGWLRVADAAVETDEALQRWVDLGLGFARALPPK